MIDLKILDQFYIRNKSTILEQGSPWAKYILIPSDDPQHEILTQYLLHHENIKQLVVKLADPVQGIPSLAHRPADFRAYGSFYWTLRFLADLGLTANELQINHLVRQLQLQQQEHGQFMIRYHRNKQQIISLICMTAHLTYCLIRLGFKESATVNAALNYIITTQRYDGGWHCDRFKQTGESEASASSCPAANIQVLRVLGQFGNRFQSIALSALNQLLKNFDPQSLPGCEFHSFQNVNWKKLRYPPHWTGLDLLNRIQTLSFFPQLADHPYFHSLVNSVLASWDGANWLQSAKHVPEWSHFDFGTKQGRSGWITSLFLEAVMRVHANSIPF